MICAVCREGMASLWEPKNPRKLGHIKEFPEVLRHQHPKLKEDDDVDEMLSTPPPLFYPHNSLNAPRDVPMHKKQNPSSLMSLLEII